jgi:hypothetical protein
MALKSADQ